MARPPRITEPGVVYHLLNRRVMRLQMFGEDQDDQTFQQALAESLDRPGSTVVAGSTLVSG